jgi:hypothetical protein
MIKKKPARKRVTKKPVKIADFEDRLQGAFRTVGRLRSRTATFALASNVSGSGRLTRR